MGMKHLFKSTKPDPVDTTLVGATKWNADHYFLDASEAPIGALGDLPYRGTDGLVTLLSGAQGILASAGSGNVPAYTMTPVLTSVSVTNAGLKVLDSDASHYLSITPGSNLSADRVLTITTGDAARTVTLSGNPTLADWFDQSVKAASSPTFVTPVVTSIAIGGVTIDATDAGKIDGITNGTTAASKALVADANGAMDILRTASLRVGTSGSETTITATGAELNTLAGVTPGTVTASKVVVVDANKDLATFRHLTLSGNIVIGATTLGETDLAKIDAVTNGTGAAGKALVLDSNADITAGLRNLAATGFFQAPYIKLGPNNWADAGAIRTRNGESWLSRNLTNTVNYHIAGLGNDADNELTIGDTGVPTRIKTSLAAPSNLGNGQWWVECTGSSPSRVCAINVRDGGATRTIASVTY